MIFSSLHFPFPFSTSQNSKRQLHVHSLREGIGTWLETAKPASFLAFISNSPGNDERIERTKYYGRKGG